MATDKKISELDPIVGNLDLSDVGVTVRSDTDFKFTFAQLLTLLQGSVITGAVITFSNDTPPNTSGKNGDVVIKPGSGQFYQRVSGVWQLQYTISPGTLGNQIIYGAGAPNNATGNDNDSYIDTSAGVFYKKLSGVWTIEFTMASGPSGATGPAGANGTNGADGKTILNGTTNPSNDLGTEGDFYLNTTNYVLFGPKISGVWGDGFPLVSNISPVYNGDAVYIPGGTSLTGDPGYFDIDYSTYISGHGPNPGIFVLKVIVNNPPIEGINEIIYDVPVQSITSTQLDTLRIFPHIDPSDPTKSIDDIIVLIK